MQSWQEKSKWQWYLIEQYRHSLTTSATTCCLTGNAEDGWKLKSIVQSSRTADFNWCQYCWYNSYNTNISCKMLHYTCQIRVTILIKVKLSPGNPVKILANQATFGNILPCLTKKYLNHSQAGILVYLFLGKVSLYTKYIVIFQWKSEQHVGPVLTKQLVCRVQIKPRALAVSLSKTIHIV